MIFRKSDCYCFVSLASLAVILTEVKCFNGLKPFPRMVYLAIMAGVPSGRSPPVHDSCKDRIVQSRFSPGRLRETRQPCEAETVEELRLTVGFTVSSRRGRMLRSNALPHGPFRSCFSDPTNFNCPHLFGSARSIVSYLSADMPPRT